MKVITLLNEKGGVCKSTMAIHIACGLAYRGQRVVLIDTDPQGIIGYYFGMEPPDHYYEMVATNRAWDSIRYSLPPERYEPPTSVSQGDLAIVMGNKRTRNIVEDVTDAFALRKRLAELRDTDVVVIDTAPTPSLAMSLVYAATDAVIYPTELSRMSLQSLLNSLQSRQGARDTQGREIEIMGFIPTKTRMTTVEHQENYKLLVGEFGDLVWPGTSLSITWEEAAGQGQTIFSYAPESKGAREMWAIVDCVEEALGVTADGTR